MWKNLGNATEKPKQKHSKTSKEYAEGMQNTTKNKEPLLVHVNVYHCI